MPELFETPDSQARPSSTAPRPIARRRKILLVALPLALLALVAICTWPRWGWRIAALRETPLTGPWRLPDQPVTVLTWNIKFGERLAEALDVIRAQKPDVVCLQEIKPGQMSTIERALDMDGHWSPSSNLIGDAAWGNAVFVAGTLDQVQSMRDADGRAFGIWASAEVKGGRFIVASVHPMHAKRKDGGIGVRLRETKALLNAYALLEAPAIIAGDFNEPPIGAVYRLMTASFDDAAPDSGATLPAGFPLTRVDYIFSSNDWQARSGHVIATTISDHRPVLAVLDVAPSANEPVTGSRPSEE